MIGATIACLFLIGLVTASTLNQEESSEQTNSITNNNASSCSAPLVNGQCGCDTTCSQNCGTNCGCAAKQTGSCGCGN